MTQKDKELLLKDLCARLPYGVMVKAQYKDGEGWKIDDRKLLGLYTNGQVYLDCVYTTIDCIKPYLRPMSSMTEKERDELEILCDSMSIDDEGNADIYIAILKNHNPILFNTKVIDWLNSHHFDYRGLIEKGLALEAPEGVYDTSQKWTTIRSGLKENEDGQIVGGLKL